MRLIDREDLSMELANEVLDAYAKADFRFAHALNVFQGLINKAPTVEERKHGHWLTKKAWHVECSECHHVLEFICDVKNYCPYCGAKMDGEPE